MKTTGDMKNYILTYCSGYEQHVYDRFVYSLFDTGFRDQLVIFLEEKDLPARGEQDMAVIDQLQAHGLL